MTEDEMVGWHHQLSEHELEQTLGDCEGQGSLACCSPWGGNNLEIEQQQQQQFMAGRNVNGKATVGSNWQLSEMLRVESPLVSTCSRLNV